MVGTNQICTIYLLFDICGKFCYNLRMFSWLIAKDESAEVQFKWSDVMNLLQVFHKKPYEWDGTEVKVISTFHQSSQIRSNPVTIGAKNASKDSLVIKILVLNKKLVEIKLAVVFMRLSGKMWL